MLVSYAALGVCALLPYIVRNVFHGNGYRAIDLAGAILFFLLYPLASVSALMWTVYTVAYWRSIYGTRHRRSAFRRAVAERATTASTRHLYRSEPFGRSP